MIDLVCLVADRNMEAVVQSLLGKHQALGIRAVTSEIIQHPQHDPGCYRSAESLLGLYPKQASHGLVLLDRAWDGIPDKSSVELEADVDRSIARLGNGWAKSIVIDPELEVWLFSRSPRLDEAIGWRGREPTLAEELARRGSWPTEASKPNAPKATMQWALSRVGKQKSSSIYGKIVANIGLAKCTDPSFLRLQSTLQAWFPLV